MNLWLTSASYGLIRLDLLKLLKFIFEFVFLKNIFYRIETSTKLSSWRSSRGTTGNSETASSDFGNKSKTSSEFGKKSSNKGKTSYDFEKASFNLRNTPLEFEKTSDSEDWTTSRGRLLGKADSSYGSWTGGSSPARDSSTSPKSSFSSSSNSLGARVGLSTLK